MLVAVTGASGHLGANLVRALLARGEQVRVLVREDRRAVAGLEVEAVAGDVDDPDSLLRLCSGAEVVYHCAARISIVGREGGLVERTNVEGVANVIAACRAAGVRRLVHTSSIHAFCARPAGEVIDERRTLALGRREAPYDRSKARGTTLVLEAAGQGLDAVVVHPGAIIGPHDYKVSRVGSVVLDLYHRRLPALIDGGYSWVDGRDVADGMLAAAERGRRGELYLLTGHWAPVQELAALVTKLTGRRTPRWPTPRWLAWLAAWPSLWYGRLRGRTPKFTPEAVVALGKHRFISHLKASEELGYRVRPLEQTVRDTLAWFEQAGYLTGSG